MYKAIITPVTVRPHPNADRLNLGLCYGHQVIVSKEVESGTLGIFFPTDGELSDEMILNNDLYNESSRNKLGLPLEGHKFGFFDTKRRIRAQKFRGEKSDGFWTELDTLAWTGADLSSLREGDQIDSLNGKVVCQKYYTPATLRAMKGGTKAQKVLKSTVFPKHKDTDQLRYYIGSIPKGSLISITEKLHGTSGRYGHVIEREELTGLRKLWSRICGKGVTRSRWVHLNGSKNVVLKEDEGANLPGWYGTNEFRYNLTNGITLHKGEIIYFEIVGYVSEGKPIMEPQPIKDELKDLRKVYGDTMRYVYGQPDGTYGMYVYRITQVNEDGVEIDYSWNQVQDRSAQLGLKVVPTIYNPFIFYDDAAINTEWLDDTVKVIMDGASLLDPSHIREGVVLRVENTTGTRFYKSKSWTFGVLEGYIKDDESKVDLEEVS